MAVQDLKTYPISTPSGQPIPLEIVRCAALIRQPFSAVAVNNIVIPPCDYLYFYSDQLCIVALGKAVTIPAVGVFVTDEYIIPPSTIMIIDHQNVTNFGVIRVSADGSLWCQCVEKYKDIRKNIQFAHN